MIKFDVTTFDKDTKKFLRKMNKVSGNVQEEAKKGSQEAADYLKKESQKRCPVDEGDLEAAHQSKAYQRISDRSWIAEVWVDGSYLKSKRGRDYHEYAHELIEPAGWQKLREKSLAKQAENPDVVVGGAFLERAIEEEGEAAVDKVFERLMRTFKDDFNRDS